MKNKILQLNIIGAILICCAVFAFGQTQKPDCHCETLPSFVEQIVAVSENLDYVSETNAEVAAFYRNKTVQDVSAGELKRVLRLDPKQLVYEESADDFFARVIIRDDGVYWLSLRDIMTAHLTEIKVFKIPRPRPFRNAYDYFVIGQFQTGQLVGIQTFSIET